MYKKTLPACKSHTEPYVFSSNLYVKLEVFATHNNSIELVKWCLSDTRGSLYRLRRNRLLNVKSLVASTIKVY